MLSEELFDAFRSDVSDQSSPHLWSDSEVYRYMNDAYAMFVRLTGGVPDSTSDLTQIDVVAGEADAEVSPLILKFREARLLSTGLKLTIVNHTDLPMTGGSDYGNIRSMYLNKMPGPVRYMLVGKQRKLVTWLQVPVEDDTVSLIVDRLPLDRITGEGQEFVDIGEEHHEHLMLWMKSRAYGKQDADTFDRGRRDEYKKEFIAYCEFAKGEMARYKSKVRSVAYGGL